jgi:hypothetical protein
MTFKDKKKNNKFSTFSYITCIYYILYYYYYYIIILLYYYIILYIFLKTSSFIFNYYFYHYFKNIHMKNKQLRRFIDSFIISATGNFWHSNKILHISDLYCMQF